MLWQDGRGEGFDRCALLPVVAGMRLTGTATLGGYGPGATARYVLLTDATWRVVACDVRMSAPGHDVRVRLTSPEPGRWEGDGGPVPAIEGCLDVSLDFTPAALTPLIRRTALAVGERVEVVHLSLPELAVRRSSTAIEHDSADRFLHHVGGRTHALHVGAQGLVTEYEDAWTAVAFG